MINHYLLFLALSASSLAVVSGNSIHGERATKIDGIFPSQRKLQKTDPSIYEDESWEDLPQLVRQAYKKLGYTAALWESSGVTVWDDYDYWELPAAQKEALQFLGYTEEQWCEDKCFCAGNKCNILVDYIDYDWVELPANVKKAAIALGYTEEIWCTVDGVNECTPVTSGSTNKCQAGEGYWNLQLTTDNAGFETKWGLYSAVDGLVSGGPPAPYNYADNTNYFGVKCLPVGNYYMRWNDLFSDGVCCDYGEGKWIVKVNGEVVLKNDPSDDSFKQKDFPFMVVEES